jgi:hypothetical protein
MECEDVRVGEPCRNLDLLIKPLCAERGRQPS